MLGYHLDLNSLDGDGDIYMPALGTDVAVEDKGEAATCATTSYYGSARWWWQSTELEELSGAIIHGYDDDEAVNVGAEETGHGEETAPGSRFDLTPPRRPRPPSPRTPPRAPRGRSSSPGLAGPPRLPPRERERDRPLPQGADKIPPLLIVRNTFIEGVAEQPAASEARQASRPASAPPQVADQAQQPQEVHTVSAPRRPRARGAKKGKNWGCGKNDTLKTVADMQEELKVDEASQGSEVKLSDAAAVAVEDDMPTEDFIPAVIALIGIMPDEVNEDTLHQTITAISTATRVLSRLQGRMPTRQEILASFERIAEHVNRAG